MREADHDSEDPLVPVSAGTRGEEADPGDLPEHILGLGIGGWVAASAATAFVCLVLGAFIGFFIVPALAAGAAALGLTCFWLRLAARWVVVGLLAVALQLGVLSLFGPFAAAFHQAGLPAINAVTDYEEREFWYDYERMGTLPRSICREKGDELECTTVTTREELLEVFQPILAEEGGEILQGIGGVFLLAAGYLAVLSAYTQLFMGWPARTERLEQWLERLGRWDRNGIRIIIGAVAVMGPGLVLFGAFDFLDVHYERAGGISGEYFALLWPAIILDKVNFLASAAILFGLGMIALGGPARRACVRGVFSGWAWGWQGMGWINWMAWGLIILPMLLLVPVDFVVKTFRELAVAGGIVDDVYFLYRYDDYPGWLQTIYGIEDIYPLLLGAGLMLLVGYFFRFLMFWVGGFTILAGAVWLGLQLVGWVGGHWIGPIIVMAFGVFLLTLTGGYEPPELGSDDSGAAAGDSDGPGGRSGSGGAAPAAGRGLTAQQHAAYLAGHRFRRLWPAPGGGRRGRGGARGTGPSPAMIPACTAPKK